MKEILGTDINGRVDYSLPPPTYCWNVGLVANTIKRILVPDGYNRVFFSYTPGATVFVTMNGDDPIIFPNGAWDNPQEINPSIRQIKTSNNQDILMLSEAACYVNLRYDLGTSIGGSSV